MSNAHTHTGKIAKIVLLLPSNNNTYYYIYNIYKWSMSGVGGPFGPLNAPGGRSDNSIRPRQRRILYIVKSRYTFEKTTGSANTCHLYTHNKMYNTQCNIHYVGRKRTTSLYRCRIHVQRTIMANIYRIIRVYRYVYNTTSACS